MRTDHPRSMVPLLLALILVALSASCGGRGGEAASQPQAGEEIPPDGAPPEDSAFSEEDGGREVEISSGGRFTVSLAENITTGYSWAVETSPGLKILEDELLQSSSGERLVGAGGVHVWTVEATAAGTQSFRAVYRRPWEEPDPDARTFSLTIRVR